jgi:glycerol uptake facilitator-like aquaporin
LLLLLLVLYLELFGTYPAPNISTWQLALEQAVASGLFVILVLSITDKKNGNMSYEKCAVLIGLMITLINCGFGLDGCNVINPARDFSPRFFTFIAGWGVQVFTAGNYFFWIPICMPLIGSFFGSIIYLVFISNHL